MSPEQVFGDAALSEDPNRGCLGLIDGSGPSIYVSIGDVEYERRGAVLTRVEPWTKEDYVIGQVTDVKSATLEGLGLLQDAAAWFERVGVDAVAITGDSGDDRNSIYIVVASMAELGVPVLVIPGNRECRSDYADAMEYLSAEVPNIVDMTSVRVFNPGPVSVLSLPGYYHPKYVKCPEACTYEREDVHALDDAVALSTSPIRVLLSHGPPRMKGSAAIDWIFEQVNVGDPAMAERLARGDIQFGLFGNIQEAGGRASTLSGDGIPPGVLAKQLYLNSGPCDSVPWRMLEGYVSHGQVGALTIGGSSASYQIKHLRPTLPYALPALPAD